MPTSTPASDSDRPIDPNQELAGLDRIVEVIARLVLKFGRATSALLAIGGLLILCLIILIVSMVQFITIRNEMRDLLDRQELLIKSQARLEKSALATQVVLEETQKKVSETQAKVETVAESTPKIKVDSKTGKTRLVIQKPAVAPPSVSAPSKPAEVEFNIGPGIKAD